MKKHNIKSALVIAIMLVLMIGLGYFVNNLNGTITGAVVGKQCRCAENIDCDDNNLCTEDMCLYKEDCEAAVCVNKEILNCKK